MLFYPQSVKEKEELKGREKKSRSRRREQMCVVIG